ncbi:MAG: branched-chain amino acid ABC transporter permease [Chloroflexi bacterium]|nr:branched-chain amino acid ABC transporter permease [Chloroflexota bacterium]
MQLFGEQVISGLATGSIYALLALAIVLIYRSTDVVNFAQGEMAMLVTFSMWSLTLAGFPPWTVIFIGISLGFALGAFVERTIIRPVEDKPPLNVVVVTLGLFVLLNSIATWIWAQGELPKVFPTPFEFTSVDVGLARVTTHSIGILVVALIVMGVLYLLFNHTKLGLGMRATAHNPGASRLMGINVGRMLMLGWGLAGAVGAVAGMLVAPITFLFPGFMLAVLLYAFAAAVFGGLDSPPGAIVGGLVVGVAENLFGTYTPGDIFGPEMKLPLTLLLLVIVLMFRPQGLFGRVQTRRV